MSRRRELFSVRVTTSVVPLHDTHSNATRVALAPEQAIERLISLPQHYFQVSVFLESRPRGATDPTWLNKLRETCGRCETLHAVETNGDSAAHTEHVLVIYFACSSLSSSSSRLLNISSALHKTPFKNLFSFWHIFFHFLFVPPNKGREHLLVIFSAVRLT